MPEENYSQNQPSFKTFDECRKEIALANDFESWKELKKSFDSEQYEKALGYAADLYLINGDRGGIRPPHNGGRI